MTEGQDPQEPKAQIEAASKAFEQEFERFACFIDVPAIQTLSLADAEAALRDLNELRVRHLGKKSVLAASKRSIGRVATEERAAFGQLVQATEARVLQALDTAEKKLKAHAETA